MNTAVDTPAAKPVDNDFVYRPVETWTVEEAELWVASISDDVEPEVER